MRSSTDSQTEKKKLQQFKIIFKLHTYITAHMRKKLDVKEKANMLFSPYEALCTTLCDPMDYSMPSFPVLHHLPELAETRDH